jgi:hypothetical protein
MAAGPVQDLVLFLQDLVPHGLAELVVLIATFRAVKCCIYVNRASNDQEDRTNLRNVMYTTLLLITDAVNSMSTTFSAFPSYSW